MSLPQNIILLGFMGSGKSTTGRELSQKIGFHYWDMDQWIEENNKKTVSEIFETKGENYFRMEEIKALSWVSDKTHHVMSLGGGAWLSRNLREGFLKLGWCVWLRVSPEQSFSRVENNLIKRPILANSKHPLESITSLLTERNPIYSQAHFKVDTDKKTPKEVATEIYESFLKVKPFDLSQLPL